MKSQRWETVVFDLDGTLADTINVIVRSYKHAVKTVLGEDVDDDVARGWIGLPLSDTYARLNAERWPEIERAYRAYNEAHLEELVEPYPGVAEMLRDLTRRGIRHGVVTSKRRHVAGLTLTYAGLAGLTPILCGLEDTAKHKPLPDPVLLGVARLDADPSTSVYVGDAVFDIQAARAAGMDSIGVTWGAGTKMQLDAAGPTFLCHSVDELSELLG